MRQKYSTHSGHAFAAQVGEKPRKRRRLREKQASWADHHFSLYLWVRGEIEALYYGPPGRLEAGDPVESPSLITWEEYRSIDQSINQSKSINQSNQSINQFKSNQNKPNQINQIKSINPSINPTNQSNRSTNQSINLSIISYLFSMYYSYIVLLVLAFP